MCELMGLSFAKPISADFSIREFAIRDLQNADGWGLAWYPDRSAAIVKEPISWRSSQHTGFLESYHGLLSSLYIAHVRHKTVGGDPTHADTHPFSRELNGRDYCFAHNGTLVDLAAAFPLGRYRPIGHTDSEYAFCHLLDGLADEHGNLDSEESWQWLHATLSEMNRRGKLNCLLSDGRRLFAYHDANGYKGLTTRKIHVPTAEGRKFEDREIKIALEDTAAAAEAPRTVAHDCVNGTTNGSADHASGSNVANQGVMVATHPLSGSSWHPLSPGELIVLSAGKLCFSSARATVRRRNEPAHSEK